MTDHAANDSLSIRNWWIQTKGRNYLKCQGATLLCSRAYMFRIAFVFLLHIKVLEQASDTNLEELLLSAGLSGPASTKDKKTGGAFAGTSRGPESQSKARPVTPKV
jgi:hypothetical protein